MDPQPIPQEFSPFEAPVKDVKSPANSAGMKMEEITDQDLDGTKNTAPNDAPEFVIPDNLDSIPNAERMGPRADPNAPGTAEATGAGTNSTGAQGGGGSGGTTKMDDGFRREFGEYTAKWLIDMFFRLVLLAVRTYAKIDRSEIMLAIDQGHIDNRFLAYVDEANKNVETKLDVSETEKKFVIEPLKYFIEVKNIQMSPAFMVAGSLLMVIVTLAIRAYDVKKENKRILDRIIKESASIRRANRGRRNNNSYEAPEAVNFHEQPVSEPTFTVEPDPVPPEPTVEVEVVVPEEVVVEPNPDND